MGDGVIPEPQLDDEQRRAFERGVAEYNAGFFFECHDTLEDLWSGLRGPSRDFFQGLIQVAVAFYHLGSGNVAGASSMLSRALARLEGYPPRFFGIDLEAHRAELREWRARVERGDAGGFSADQAPRWRFDPDTR